MHPSFERKGGRSNQGGRAGLSGVREHLRTLSLLVLLGPHHTAENLRADGLEGRSACWALLELKSAEFLQGEPLLPRHKMGVTVLSVSGYKTPQSCLLTIGDPSWVPQS